MKNLDTSSDKMPVAILKMIIKFLSEFFGYYYLLFFFSFLSIYYFPSATPYFTVFILFFSYYLILVKKRFDIVLILILYSRCLNGFVFQHNKVVFDIMNVLTSVMPMLLYVTGYLYRKTIVVKNEFFVKYKFTFLFFIFLTLSFLFNFNTSYDLITKRYLPFTFFLLFILFFNRPNDFNVYGMLRFFRNTFLASIILYFGQDYLLNTKTLMESDAIFGVVSPPRAFSLVYLSFVRNMGFTWDHRIVAIMAYLYALLSLSHKPKYFTFDILLSSAVVITSTSRGGMITYALVMAAYLFQLYRKQFAAGLLVAIPVSVFVIALLSLNPPKRFSEFLNSFDPNSRNNAISQREFFSDYAINAYQNKPIFGNGVGFLSSRLIDRHLVVDGTVVPSIGDAYWYVLLAEMGLVGLILYILFLLEVFFSSSILNVALLVGFSIQLLGTDIPDIRFFYFATLVLVYQVNLKLKQNLIKKHTALEN